MNRSVLAGLGLVLLTASAWSLAYAHAPVVELKDSTDAEPIEISWPLDISVAVYGYFETANDVDVLRFSLSQVQAERGQQFYVHTLVPACTVYKDLLPTVAIVGPVQAALTAPGAGQSLPFSIDTGAGVMLLKNERQGNAWYEPYSKKNYFWQASRSITLASAGNYKVHIWSPHNRTGDYVLAIGTRERWGLREIGRAVRNMPRLLAHEEIHSDACRQELRQQTPSPNPLPADAHSN